MHDATFAPIEPGRVIAERYRLEAPIGHGAMGSVWRARHLQLDAPVAIKLVGASLAGTPEMLERFLREARSAAAVRSSHVVQIFDYGVDGDRPYIAMELLVGEALDQRLATRGALAGPELDKIFTEVSRAVGNAHELGVIHRDIKPANIFLAREGGHEVTKVLDFGIAKLTAERLGSQADVGTHTGIILGTPRYMSPEQARGRRDVDHRSDLWSLAVLTFECMTGRQPFESSTLGGLVVEICTAEPRVPSSVARVPAGFDAWFARGVSKAPEARFQSAREMAEQLHALLAAAGLAADSRPRLSTDVRGAGPQARAASPTHRGPSFAPPVDLSPTEVLDGPGAAPVTTEPSITSAGAVSTEVLHPRTSSRRRGALIGLVLAAAALALGPGRALLRAAPSGERAPRPSATAATTGSASEQPGAAAPGARSGAAGSPGTSTPAPDTPDPARAPVSHQPATSTAPLRPEQSGPAAAAAPSQAGTALARERARPSRSRGKRPKETQPASGPASASAGAPAPAPPTSPSSPTPQPFDPYSDRL
jgi:serine/threonine-protein kinase